MGVNDLINVLEQPKSGIIINNRYGQNDTLLVPPCHIVISGNYLPYGSLSPDRWKVFKIIKEKGKIDWKDISKEKQAEAKMEIEKEQMREIIKKQKETKFILKNMETLDIDKNKLTKIKESLKKSLIS
jgi:histidyl-tRNA synthetase